MASLVILTSDGRSVEVAIVGKEGMVGTPLAVGLDRGPYRAVVQITGSGCRIKSELLVHEIEQRLARWLLMCQDRVESDILLVTHDFLAQMLGTGRPSVSLAAGTLQRSGMIENLRGRVRIVNRTDLENAACECYRALKQFNGSLGIRYT